jgi:hypothetical protein
MRKLAQLARIELFQPDLIFLSEPFEDLEGPDLALAEGLVQGWAADPARLIMAAAEGARAGLLPEARRWRLEDGRIHTAGEAP